MKQLLFVVIALLTMSGRALSQSPAAGVTPDAVVARLMSFDRNGDGQLVARELPERMHTLLSRGDGNRSGGLEASEIRTIATAPPPAPSTTTAPRVVAASRYAFADRTELTTRSHIEGALEDLRLAPATRDVARTIAVAYAELVDTEARADFLTDLATILTEPQLRTVAGILDPRNRTGRTSPDHLERQFTQFGLQPSQQAQATAALERFTARIRLTGADRAELATHLTGILTPMDRGDLEAALARRPLVKTDGATVFTGVSGGITAVSQVGAFTGK